MSVESMHNVLAGATYEQMVAHAVNTQDLVGAATRSRWFSVSPPTERTYSLVPEEFQLSQGSLKTGAKGTFEIDTSADLMRGSCLVVALPGIVGMNMDADSDGSGNKARIVNAGGVISEPYWCEGVGQRLVKQVEFRTGNQTQAVSFSDYMMVMTEAFGDNKPRMQGERIGYYGDLQEQCERSRSTQLLYVDFHLFFELDPTASLSLVSMQVHKLSFRIEFERLSNLIVRPDVSANQFSTGLGTANVDGTGASTQEFNGWDVNRLQVYTLADGVALADAADNLGDLLLSNGKQEIELEGHVEGQCVVVRKEESKRLSRSNYTTVIKQVQRQEFTASGNSKADKQVDLGTLSPTNALYNLFIVARTEASIAANDWMNTSAGPVADRPTMYNPLVRWVKLTQSSQARINASGDYLQRQVAADYFKTEPRHKKTMLPVWSFQADRESTGGFSNAPKYRNRQLLITIAKEGFTAEGSEVSGMIFCESANTWSVSYGAGQADWVASLTL